MKIIVFGSGALGSLMIHFLCKAGNDVTVVARSTADELRRNGLIVKHYLQRKTSIDHPTILESVPTDEHFDIAFSVMQGQQQKELLETFKKLDTNILVLVGNNLEADFCQNSILEKRPDLHLLFGFQNSAGHREGDKSIAARLPVTKLFVGGLHNAASETDLVAIQKAFNPNNSTALTINFSATKRSGEPPLQNDFVLLTQVLYHIKQKLQHLFIAKML